MVAYKKKALKALRRMPKQYADRFVVSFNRIASGEVDDLDIKSLQGRDAYRLRNRRLSRHL